MDILIFVLKLLLLPALVALMASPLLMEAWTFSRDKKKKISYKRLRIVIWAAVYFILATIALCLLDELWQWLQSLGFVQWLANNVALANHTIYFAELIAVMIINFLIGAAYRLLSKLVRIGLKKKNLLTPKKKDGEFTLRQTIERKIIKFFHTEGWFFVAEILKWVGALLSIAYALVFILYLAPAVFGADWLPYGFIRPLFESGYLYPTLTLLLLWQIYFFLAGIKRVEDECPELLRDEDEVVAEKPVDLATIDAEVKKQFGDFYACDVDLSAAIGEELASSSHDRLSELIARAAERDARDPRPRTEVWMDGLDKLVASDSSLLINGSFFSGFSAYFLRWLAVILARGDNVVLVCNSDDRIDSVYDYLVDGLSKISSLYCKDFADGAVDFDDPIWRVIKVSGEHAELEDAAVDENNVLVTSLGYLCSTRFENEHSRFITLIDAVVFVDSLATVNTYNRQLAILNTRLAHIARSNALEARNGRASDLFRMRYMSRSIRYICFDDTRTPGLDKVLKNMLSVELETADAMRFSPSTIVRCYNFEPRADADGRRSVPQFIGADEELGALMNMAVLCLAKGATSVSVFTDEAIPYENIAESVSANMGRASVELDGSRIRIDRPHSSPDDYSVIIALDSSDDLPAALRKYISICGEKPALVIVFSRPYLLRDYYHANISRLWHTSRIGRIPVEEGTKKDVAQRIVVRANAGGIATEDVLRLASGVAEFDRFVKKDDVSGVLRAVLGCYGIPLGSSADLFRYFEYISTQDFDENGKYRPQVRVVLRRQGELAERINGRDMAQLVTDESEFILPLPRSRLTQNHIAGQNLLYGGDIYNIRRIDVASGRVYARLAVGGLNDEAYRYLQSREYRVELSEDKLEHVLPTRRVRLSRSDGDLRIDELTLAAFRAPTEVLTRGYYEIDPHTLNPTGDDRFFDLGGAESRELALQTYRRYGAVSEPAFSSDSVLGSTELSSSQNGALMLSIRIGGEFGADADKTARLAAAMLGETLRSTFPSVADSVAVCAVLSSDASDGDAAIVRDRLPRVNVLGERERADFELLIIEDCASDLGVVSVLMTAGDDLLHTLFAPIADYLKWRESAESDYLRFGADHELDCFDFDATARLAKLLGDDRHDLKFVDIDTLIESEVCDFCGKRHAALGEIVTLDDGRKMCRNCAENLVSNNKKILKSHLDRAKIFLESSYGISLGDDCEFCFESTVKIANTLKRDRSLMRRGADAPLKSYVDGKNRVFVETDIPSVNLSELLVRELTHVWQRARLPMLDEELAEGQIALVAIQYLRFLGSGGLASSRANYYESTSEPSGKGYRRLVRELLQNPQFKNNSFAYLLSANGGSTGDTAPAPTPSEPSEAEFGKPYAPASPDRTPGGAPYFHRERLTATRQAIYDALCVAVSNHIDGFTLDSGDFDDLKAASTALLYDHPELFWYKTFSLRGGTEVNLFYGASAEEVALLRPRIDEAAAKYLSGIDETMSAYDVALRLHAKLIASVDYDTIALDRQKKEGGPATDKIDYLRTICGVLLDGKAVCEGYARTLEYLLQKCGIECAEVAGMIKKESGEEVCAHAWNILRVDGDYYYIDTTWDDSSNTVQDVKKTDLGFDYFCITTDELLRTRDLSLGPTELPGCIATKANYFSHNDLVLDRYDLARIKAIAEAAAAAGAPSFSFKCRTRALYEQALDRLCAKGDDCFEALRAASRKSKSIDPNGYSYTYDKNIWTITVKFRKRSAK